MEAPGVKLAAALVLKDGSGTDRLVGYVSPDAVDKDAIVAELKQRLPAHFVPSLIVPLPEMPLSPAGKVTTLPPDSGLTFSARPAVRLAAEVHGRADGARGILPFFGPFPGPTFRVGVWAEEHAVQAAGTEH